MDYSKLSDFEINKLVARALDGLSVNDSTTDVDCYLSANKSNCVKWYKVDFDDPSEFELFNPCNDPSDAWPIILKHEISLIDPTSAGLDGEWTASKFYPSISKDDVEHDNENPLRAAMIVYLMMQEDK